MQIPELLRRLTQQALVRNSQDGGEQEEVSVMAKLPLGMSVLDEGLGER